MYFAMNFKDDQQSCSFDMSATVYDLRAGETSTLYLKQRRSQEWAAMGNRKI